MVVFCHSRGTSGHGDSFSGRAAGGLEGHQIGGLEQERVQVLGLDGPVQ